MLSNKYRYLRHSSDVQVECAEVNTSPQFLKIIIIIIIF